MNNNNPRLLYNQQKLMNRMNQYFTVDPSKSAQSSRHSMYTKLKINTTLSFQHLLSFCSTNTVNVRHFHFCKAQFCSDKTLILFTEMFFWGVGVGGGCGGGGGGVGSGRNAKILTRPSSQNDHPMIGPLLKIYIKLFNSFQSPCFSFEKQFVLQRYMKCNSVPNV